MDRGQTAFEYLLIIGGSVLLAAVVLVFVHGNLGTVNAGIGINKLAAAVGMSCSDCDALFVNEGQPKSITQAMLADDVLVGGSGTWTQSGNNQYSAVSGNVGIGTDNPTSKLTVNGTVDVSGNVITGLAAPVDASDAANKEYVDAASGTAYGSIYSTCYVLKNLSVDLSCDENYTQIAKFNTATACWDVAPILGGKGKIATFIGVGGGFMEIRVGFNYPVFIRCMSDYNNPYYNTATACWDVAPIFDINGKTFVGNVSSTSSSFTPDCQYAVPQTLALCCK
jgi:hypothetical protein